ncbi:MAG: helix-turn-helix domain-containing protein [Veillonellaceae bacterium]|nr:helix-turn-helix domain-containing protein [Veillonellaceae bacterium]
MRLTDSTEQDREQEIQRVHQALARTAWKLAEELGVFGVVWPDWGDTPLAAMLRDIFAHALGDRDVAEVYEQCQDICEMLFSPPTEHVYDIPPAFWETLLGQAVRACIGDTSSLTDDLEVTGGQAARIANVDRTTVHRAAAAGVLPVARMVGNRRIYRAGDVRSWADAGARTG